MGLLWVCQYDDITSELTTENPYNGGWWLRSPCKMIGLAEAPGEQMWGSGFWDKSSWAIHDADGFAKYKHNDITVGTINWMRSLSFGSYANTPSFLACWHDTGSNGYWWARHSGGFALK